MEKLLRDMFTTCLRMLASKVLMEFDITKRDNFCFCVLKHSKLDKKTFKLVWQNDIPYSIKLDYTKPKKNACHLISISTYNSTFI